jgi:hypothetical protein
MSPFEPTDVDARMSEGGLVVDFCGEIHVVPDDETLVFGRAADLLIDDNEFLHRRLGMFEFRSGHWWLANVGSQIELDVFDRSTRASARIPPGTAQALPGEDHVVQFAAGPTSYELVVRCSQPNQVETATPTDTASLASIAWTEEQRLLMAILAASLISRPNAPVELPSNQEARERLGWSEAKFNRKLDNVCDRLTSSGVRGLEKGVNKRNNQRRRILAETAVRRGIITADDLHDLATYEQRQKI